MEGETRSRPSRRRVIARDAATERREAKWRKVLPTEPDRTAATGGDAGVRERSWRFPARSPKTDAQGTEGGWPIKQKGQTMRLPAS